MESIKLKFAFAFALLLGVSNCYGQNWNEIFRQKKTQQKYLLQQILALEVYASYLKKGYEIVDGGLQTIRDFTNGEFSLHNAFISSLKKVSPAVRNDLRVVEIIEMQVNIGREFNGIKANPNLSVSNQLYIQNVRENLWEESLKDLEELLMVITSGKIEMSDDERIERLNRVYFSMRDKSAFTQNFISEISRFTRQKEMEIRSIEQTRNNYGIRE
ncbi:hypothetical protein [Pedobacter cryotolerans]|uniref:TerB family tellurite resistance protein n=1 Tax=Pedobacter cryotolerans TaxID=2571270 RepID=A0A4U1C8Y4_9SPHI|nr:hypothetical protein [Pedobacter cryotolerans]TKC00043.1 hypothetical protein FA045_11425 [Pedobacter cryotolerans]